MTTSPIRTVAAATSRGVASSESGTVGRSLVAIVGADIPSTFLTDGA